jgi:hypothetical protein
MLAAGFIASPLLLNTKDVLDLYGGARIVRPSAYSVELTPGAECCWQKTINFRVYRIDDRLGR